MTTQILGRDNETTHKDFTYNRIDISDYCYYWVEIIGTTQANI